MIKTVLSTILGTVATGYALIQGHHSGPGRPLNPAFHAASVIETRSTGSKAEIVLRRTDGNLITVKVTGNTALTSRDGQRLALSDVRSGDRLSRTRGGRLVDVSQHLVTVRGVMSLAPEEQGSTLVVQTRSGDSIIADVTAHTAFTDPSGETSSTADVADSDLVQVRGVLDDTADEMTQTRAVVRLGPYNRP